MPLVYARWFKLFAAAAICPDLSLIRFELVLPLLSSTRPLVVHIDRAFYTWQS